jgi:hypothetical protein
MGAVTKILTINKVIGKIGFEIIPKTDKKFKKFKLKGFKIATTQNNFKSPPAKKPDSQKIKDIIKIIIKDKREFNKIFIFEKIIDSIIFIKNPIIRKNKIKKLGIILFLISYILENNKNKKVVENIKN